MRTLACLAFLPLVAIAQSTPPPPLPGEWERKQLTPHFWAEGINFADFNRDGRMDVVYGPFWWEGPDFTNRHEYAPATKTSAIAKPDGTQETIPGYKGALGQENEYSDNFLTFTHDLSGDGWTDIIVVGTPGQPTFWFENSKASAQPWTRHQAFDITDNESPVLTDLNGDGRPDLVCNSGGYLGYATYDPKNPQAKWIWHNISPKGTWHKYTHGIGVGDVNGDGRLDLLEANGWWEQPTTLDGDPVWAQHEARFGEGGAQMFAYDVNGDGRNDVITSLAAHKYGVAWFEQTDDGGVVGWQQHVLVGSKPEDGETGLVFSQPHALALIDMNGDGLKDIVTGKRFWAHGPKGDPEPNAWPVLWWFELKCAGGKASFTPHLIDDASGVGTQVVAGDLNGDAKPDVLVGNKRGAFVFLKK